VRDFLAGHRYISVAVLEQAAMGPAATPWQAVPAPQFSRRMRAPRPDAAPSPGQIADPIAA
jgi:hypothetical protein